MTVGRREVSDGHKAVMGQRVGGYFSANFSVALQGCSVLFYLFFVVAKSEVKRIICHKIMGDFILHS